MEASSVAVTEVISQAGLIHQDSVVPMWIFYVALAVVGILIVVAMYFANRSEDASDFEVWKFVATLGKEGKFLPDLTKLGQWHGIIATTFVIILMSAKIEHITPTEFMYILVICLTYLAGVQMFQAIVKAFMNKGNPPPKQDIQVQTQVQAQVSTQEAAP